LVMGRSAADEPMRPKVTMAPTPAEEASQERGQEKTVSA